MWNVMKHTKSCIAMVAIAGAITLLSTSAAQAQPQTQTQPQAQTPAPLPPTQNGAAAGEPQPALLPDVPLVGRNGAAVPGAAAFPLTGRWLLVVVRPNCAPCDALLARSWGARRRGASGR